MPRDCGVPDILWAPWHDRIVAMHSRGIGHKDKWLALKAEGLDVKLASFNNYCYRHQLYVNAPTGPRVGETATRSPVRKVAEGRTASVRDLGLLEYNQQPRLCQRPALGRHTSLTAYLMGDPPPGRTPWAA